MRCMTPLGVKGHIKVRVRVRVGISESHYGANQAIYISRVQFSTNIHLCCPTQGMKGVVCGPGRWI